MAFVKFCFIVSFLFCSIAIPLTQISSQQQSQSKKSFLLSSGTFVQQKAFSFADTQNKNSPHETTSTALINAPALISSIATLSPRRQIVTETSLPRSPSSPYQEPSILPDISGGENKITNDDNNRNSSNNEESDSFPSCEHCSFSSAVVVVPHDRDALHLLANDAEAVNTSVSAQLEWRKKEDKRTQWERYKNKNVHRLSSSSLSSSSSALPSPSPSALSSGLHQNKQTTTKITNHVHPPFFSSTSATSTAQEIQIAASSVFSFLLNLPSPSLSSSDTCTNTTQMQENCQFQYMLCSHYNNNNHFFSCNVSDLKSQIIGSSAFYEISAQQAASVATVILYQKLTSLGENACNTVKSFVALEPECALKVSVGFFFMTTDDIQNAKAFYHTIVVDDRTGVAGSGDNPEAARSYYDALTNLAAKQPNSFCPSRELLKRQVQRALKTYGDGIHFHIGNISFLGTQISHTLSIQSKLSKLLTQTNILLTKLPAASSITNASLHLSNVSISLPSPSSLSLSPREEWQKFSMQLTQLLQVYTDRLKLLSVAIVTPPT